MAIKGIMIALSICWFIASLTLVDLTSSYKLQVTDFIRLVSIFHIYECTQQESLDLGVPGFVRITNGSGLLPAQKEIICSRSIQQALPVIQ